ncbi:hypothetical protein C2845_PM03G26320 [Panicum miliaceum]|uniref:BOP1 N-terminal domain-containing protein n=1 Tax=Panicum miliaceum TaxID=4540 RepID=A0A3L6T7Z4_PANMI|nr:hypothetical protein C2845_PM03G26320 [Panicum miliaceum]
MGHDEGEREHEGDDLSADDSSWSDGVWSQDDDEVAPRNTVGDVPLEWYKDEEHIGYDIEGRKIKKRDRDGRIEAYLRNADDDKNCLGSQLLSRFKSMFWTFGYDYVDWFEYEDKGHPLSSAPEPKRRFVPSKWEQKKVVKLVRAIRNGWIKFDKPKDEPNLYLLWGDETDTADNKWQGLSYIPAPKPNLPGHEESYNPSVEYIPTQEEIDSYQLIYEEDRPKFIPKRFESLRSVPAYEKALREGFDRCLDLYLCPKTRKKRINIDPESLKPKLPSKKDLRLYPKTCYLEFKGHTGPVKSISVEMTGQWLHLGNLEFIFYMKEWKSSLDSHGNRGFSDGTIRVWEVETGRCIKVWNVGGDVRHIAWNPAPDRPILAAIVEHDLLLLNAGVGSEEVQMRAKELLQIGEMAPQDDTDGKKPAVRWMKHEKLDGITLIHHKLLKKHSHHPFRKLPGLPVAATFHPSQKMFFVATKKFVQVYDLQKAQLVKKLESGLREISSISIHPGGDNVIVGSKDGKLCWFDTDLSTRPYKTLKTHSKDITSVTFHRKYPLFASSSEDCTAYVCHGMVYSDLNQNPLIVPLEILRGHSSSDGREWGGRGTEPEIRGGKSDRGDRSESSTARAGSHHEHVGEAVELHDCYSSDEDGSLSQPDSPAGCRGDGTSAVEDGRRLRSVVVKPTAHRVSYKDALLKPRTFKPRFNARTVDEDGQWHTGRTKVKKTMSVWSRLGASSRAFMTEAGGGSTDDGLNVGEGTSNDDQFTTPIYAKKVPKAILPAPCVKAVRATATTTKENGPPVSTRKSERVASRPKKDLTMEQQATLLLTKKCGELEEENRTVAEKIATFPERLTGPLDDDTVGGYRDLFGLKSEGCADAISALAIHADA